MKKVEHSCVYDLYVDSSYLWNAFNNIFKLKVFNSIIDNLMPSSIVNHMDLQDSMVHKLSVNVKDGSMKRCEFKNLLKLHLSGSLNVTKSSISTVHEESVVINKNSSLYIRDTEAQYLRRNSILVKGVLFLENVTLHTVDKFAFTVFGTVKLSNVSIKSTSGAFKMEGGEILLGSTSYMNGNEFTQEYAMKHNMKSKTVFIPSVPKFFFIFSNRIIVAGVVIGVIVLLMILGRWCAKCM